jgi:hypothetical protein
VPGCNSCQHEAGNEFNPWNSHVLLPRVDLDTARDGFAMTCTDKEALNLMEDSALIANRIIDMVPVDMS